MPNPLLAWDAPRSEWLNVRRGGLGASEVYDVLGFSTHNSPWQVWADKVGRLLAPDVTHPAAKLGTDLEPWIIDQAPALLGQDVARTPHKLYAHSEHPWRRCSPDAFAADGGLVQAKTSGLASPGYPTQWANDGIPLGHELQCRWEIHVMDAPRCYLVALVAGLGLIYRVIDRDLGIENDLVSQLELWWKQHVVSRIEPPLGSLDAEAMARLYPVTKRPEVDATNTPILAWVAEYAQARDDVKAAKARQDEAGANIKRLIGDAAVAKVNGERVASWPANKNGVRSLYI
jgi:putative phage-type endonuclease